MWIDDVGKLEEAVGESAVFIIFLSKGYFRSENCRRELYTAFVLEKPIILVLETDNDKGGASFEEMRQEFSESAVHPEEFKSAVNAIPGYGSSGSAPSPLLVDFVDYVFSKDPVIWVRVHDFQVESLKLIAHRMLQLSADYARNPELEKGLMVPGEIGPFGFKGRALTRILVCDANEGARSVAEEVAAAANEGVGGARVEVELADAALDEQSEPQNMVLLLYLNRKTFMDNRHTVRRLVGKAMDRKIPIAPVHEQDTAKGGCAFGIILEQTPQELQKRKLYKTLAVPLYPMAEHRRISLRRILKSMGAKPRRRRAGADASTLCAHATVNQSGCNTRPEESVPAQTGSEAASSQTFIAQQSGNTDASNGNLRAVIQRLETLATQDNLTPAALSKIEGFIDHVLDGNSSSPMHFETDEADTKFRKRLLDTVSNGQLFSALSDIGFVSARPSAQEADTVLYTPIHQGNDNAEGFHLPAGSIYLNVPDPCGQEVRSGPMQSVRITEVGGAELHSDQESEAA